MKAWDGRAMGQGKRCNSTSPFTVSSTLADSPCVKICNHSMTMLLQSLSDTAQTSGKKNCVHQHDSFQPRGILPFQLNFHNVKMSYFHVFIALHLFYACVFSWRLCRYLGSFYVQSLGRGRPLWVWQSTCLLHTNLTPACVPAALRLVAMLPWCAKQDNFKETGIVKAVLYLLLV